MKSFISQFFNTPFEKQYQDILLEKQNYQTLLQQAVILDFISSDDLKKTLCQSQINRLKKMLDKLIFLRQKFYSWTWRDYLIKGQFFRRQCHFSKLVYQSQLGKIQQQFSKIKMTWFTLLVEHEEKAVKPEYFPQLLNQFPGGPLKDYYCARHQQKSAAEISFILYDKNRYESFDYVERCYVHVIHYYRQGEYSKAQKMCARLADKNYAPALYFWGKHFVKSSVSMPKKNLQLSLWAYAKAAKQIYVPAIFTLVSEYLDYLIDHAADLDKKKIFSDIFIKVITQQQLADLFVSEVLIFDFYEAKDLINKIDHAMINISRVRMKAAQASHEELVAFYRQILARKTNLLQKDPSPVEPAAAEDEELLPAMLHSSKRSSLIRKYELWRKTSYCFATHRSAEMMKVDELIKTYDSLCDLDDDEKKRAVLHQLRQAHQQWQNSEQAQFHKRKIKRLGDEITKEMNYLDSLARRREEVS